jgi:hypothetical protein
MKIASYLLIDIAAFFLFAFLHSFLASFKVKNYFASRFGNFMAFYRLGYTILSLGLFFYMYENLPRPDFELYDLPYPYDFLILVPQFIALAGIIWTFMYFSLFEFIGIAQIIRWKNGTYVIPADTGIPDINAESNTPAPAFNSYDEKLTLKIEGPYKVVRHPLYLFTLLFLVLRPTMDLFYFVSLICIIAYFYTGSFYEERKLVSVFGDEYRKYQAAVPRLFGLRIHASNSINL